ncbi:MAG TPA: D-alanyl-D-alanine carboxypeptidase/D-alanyl-D-alanine-endopeptidase [Ignavibacteriaceae bacterium]|nr:D-alanyl-D-alanine carboxypeptidase/D-alanyl-D-alanine-endopeptidase [Ignavibacteriaceae bacterium]
MLNKLIFIFLLAVPFRLFPAEPKGRDTIPQYSYGTIQEFWSQMDDIFNDPNFINANWGVLIQSLQTGEYFYKRNENKLFMPASNLKLFTTAGALDILGPDYKFLTNVYISGKIDGSILEGDLVVEGRGDPAISGRFYNNDLLKVFNNWADSLLAFGIDEIDGNLIGDDNLFEDKGLGQGWAWDNESYWFSAQSGALSFNDNCVDIEVTVDQSKNLPKITIAPETKYIVPVNKVYVVPEDTAALIDVYRERGTNIVTVFGKIRISDSLKTYVTVNNPTQYFMVVLKEVLKSRGIKVTGFPMDIDDVTQSLDYSKLQKLFTAYSPELKEIIKVINKNSQNFFAEQLLKTIGLETKNLGSVANGIIALNNLFSQIGINPEDMNIADGSGLSRLNFVTPKQVVDLLNYEYQSKNFVPFFNSLPIAGVDGTLGDRLKNSSLVGKVRAKTGYLESVRSLSGYAYTGDNEPVSFSIIVNNFNVPIKLAENLQDLVCLRIANFKRK